MSSESDLEIEVEAINLQNNLRMSEVLTVECGLTKVEAVPAPPIDSENGIRCVLFHDPYNFGNIITPLERNVAGNAPSDNSNKKKLKKKPIVPRATNEAETFRQSTGYSQRHLRSDTNPLSGTCNASHNTVRVLGHTWPINRNPNIRITDQNAAPDAFIIGWKAETRDFNETVSGATRDYMNVSHRSNSGFSSADREETICIPTTSGIQHRSPSSFLVHEIRPEDNKNRFSRCRKCVGEQPRLQIGEQGQTCAIESHQVMKRNRLIREEPPMLKTEVQRCQNNKTTSTNNRKPILTNGKLLYKADSQNTEKKLREEAVLQQRTPLLYTGIVEGVSEPTKATIPCHSNIPSLAQRESSVEMLALTEKRKSVGNVRNQTFAVTSANGSPCQQSAVDEKTLGDDCNHYASVSTNGQELNEESTTSEDVLTSASNTEYIPSNLENNHKGSSINHSRLPIVKRLNNFKCTQSREIENDDLDYFDNDHSFCSKKRKLSDKKYKQISSYKSQSTTEPKQNNFPSHDNNIQNDNDTEIRDHDVIPGSSQNAFICHESPLFNSPVIGKNSSKQTIWKGKIRDAKAKRMETKGKPKSSSERTDIRRKIMGFFIAKIEQLVKKAEDACHLMPYVRKLIAVPDPQNTCQVKKLYKCIENLKVENIKMKELLNQIAETESILISSLDNDGHSDSLQVDARLSPSNSKVSQPSIDLSDKQTGSTSKVKINLGKRVSYPREAKRSKD